MTNLVSKWISGAGSFAGMLGSRQEAQTRKSTILAAYAQAEMMRKKKMSTLLTGPLGVQDKAVTTQATLGV